MNSALFWLFLTLICICTQAFYSMMEMAAVSFNRIRLQYYVSKDDKRAIWLHLLLKKPSRLFGTTLLGVNIALQIGSECSRQFYASLNLPPDLAPLTQIILVLILAELAPMLAARHYAEHVAMLGIPILYASSRLMKPVTVAIGFISNLVNHVIGSHSTNSSAIFINREELQKVFEERDETWQHSGKADEFNTVVANIFSFREKTAEQVMIPTRSIPLVPSNSTVGHIRSVLRKDYYSHIPIYHRSQRNIIGIVASRDLLRAPDSHSITDYSRPPWFLTENIKILEVLEQFRRNNQNIAVVLNENGLARGIISLDDILDEIFGEVSIDERSETEGAASSQLVIERTFPGELKVREFNEQFGADLPYEGEETLSKVLEKNLEHLPEKGESVRIDRFILTVEEASLLGAKTISVKTRVQ